MVLRMILCVPWFLLAAPAHAADQCVECHLKTTANIVGDWKLSAHSEAEVGCADCHGAAHKSAEDVSAAKIPTADTCARCHGDRVKQFKRGKHALAWAAMKAMPTAHWQDRKSVV